ncbi:MAG: hypothetical protein ACXAD7_28415 [Candidatus Kariarchaeaceae archaeon]|jgi:hypothetical protein
MSTSQVNLQNMHGLHTPLPDAYEAIINRIHTSIKTKEDIEFVFEIDRITRPAIQKLKSNMYALSEMANEKNFQLKFSDLSKLPHHRCCVWWSGHQIHPTSDLNQLGVAIESNTKSNGSPLISINFSNHHA